MSTPEDEMMFILPKIKMHNDSIHHMTGKKIYRQVTPEIVSPADNYIQDVPNTEIPMNPPQE